MKFDKEMVIAIVVCGILLIGWQPLCIKMGWMADPATVKNVAPAVPVTPVASAGATEVKTPAATAKTDVLPPAAALPVDKLKLYTLANDKFSVSISPVVGGITGVTLKNYLTSDRKSDVVIDQIPSATVGVSSLQAGALALFAPGAPWQTVAVVAEKASADSLTLVRKMRESGGKQFLLTQSWKLSGNYVIKSDVTLANPSAAPLVLPRVVVSGGELQTWAASSGDRMRSDSVKLDYLTASGSFNDISGDARDSKFFRPDAGEVSWVALSNKYFISMLKSGSPFRMYQARTLKQKSEEEYIITSGAEYAGLSIPGKGSVTLNFECYAGPKIAANLNDFAAQANRTMHLAWGPLDYLARFMLWALVGLHGMCHSYGWSIVILTIIVRLVFWPVTARANASMKRMSTVQPKIKELREKYKDNPQVLNSKMMELYRTEKINPLGGCLPILLQIPVFFALYATLDSAVELRQVAFLWTHDLAAADTVGHIFGLAINPLVLAMTLLMVLQQKLTPSAMDPTQQKMMLAMPIVMLFFLYDLPSGLTLYWTVSQIFSIIQLLLQQRNKKITADPVKAVK